jgi:hypothetical protein
MKRLLPCAVLSLTGCYLGPQHLSYPTPVPSGGDRIVYAGDYRTIESQKAAGITGFESLCVSASHTSAAMTVGGVHLCFTTPMASPCLTCMNVNGFTRRGLLDFTIYVGGIGVALNSPRARLDLNGQTASAAAAVRDAGYASGPEEAPPGTKPLIPGAQVLIYPAWREQLNFHFDWPCDPAARYRLTLTGITLDGREVAVPPVDFEPYDEWVQTYVD